MSERRSRKPTLRLWVQCSVVASVVLGTLFVSHAARAQTAEGYAINHYEPPERGGNFLVGDSLRFRGGGSLRSFFGITSDYAYRPLVVLNPDDTVHTSIV